MVDAFFFFCKYCMTLRTSYLGKCSMIVYYGHAGFSVITESLPLQARPVSCVLTTGSSVGLNSRIPAKCYHPYHGDPRKIPRILGSRHIAGTLRYDNVAWSKFDNCFRV